MQQLSSIANVQNLPNSEAGSENTPVSNSSDSKPEFELQPKSRRNGESELQPEAEETIQPQSEEASSSDVEPVVTPLQLELYEFQQLDEAAASEQVMELDESLLLKVASTEVASPEPTRPRQLDAPVAELPLPLDRARQLIEVAAAAGPLQSNDGLANATQVDVDAIPSAELSGVQATSADVNEFNLTDQGNSNSFSTAANSSVPEIEPPSSSIQAGDVVKTVTSTVAENLVQQVEMTENGSDRKMIVQLHPAELGQVVLQVDWENETLKAKILTNELAANELLNQNKQELVAALAENGISFDSLDVAYQDAPNEHSGDEDSALFSNRNESNAERESVSTRVGIPTSTTMVDIVV